ALRAARWPLRARPADQGWRGTVEGTEAAPADVRDGDHRALSAARELGGGGADRDVFGRGVGASGSAGHRITGRYPGAVNRYHGIGWEFVHVCIDDASRIAFVQVLADQCKESAVAFLEAAVAHFAKLRVRIERVMTDNGSCYQSKSFRAACKRLGLRQIFTKPEWKGRTLY